MSESRCPDEPATISRARDEAQKAKDCFTDYTRQVLVIATAGTGGIAAFQFDHPEACVGHAFVVVLLAVVSRLGIYKYATANRHNGWELHLQRTAQLADRPPDGWQTSMRDTGWEEAMRAWRLVQPTVFEYLYGRSRPWCADRLKKEFRVPSLDPNCWFDIHRLANPAAEAAAASAARTARVTYHPGTYLKTALWMFSMLAWTSIALFTVGLVQLAREMNFESPAYVALCGLLVIGGLWTLNSLWVSARRRLLETEILSIHACAVVWQAVVLAHHRALGGLSRNSKGQLIDFDGYTRALADQARDAVDHLAANHLKIDGWFAQRPPPE